MRALGRQRIEVAELSAPGQELSEGQQFALVFHGEDNRAPEPGTSQSHPVRVRVVTPDDLLRRVQDRLARARVDASRLAELSREKRARVEELLDALQSDSPLDAGDQSSLAAALTGARLVQGDARSIARDLASVTETVLYARLDEKAGTALELLDGLLAESTDREFHHEPWAELASAHSEGHLGAPGFAGSLIDILGLSVTIAEGSAQSAVAALDASAHAPSAAERQDMLVAAVEAQTLALSQIEDLLERLAEWDNFQSVLALTRDILNRQQSLTERLREYGSER